MDREGSWGTEVEILTLAHFLQTPVLVYNTEHEGWSRYSPRNVDVALDDDVTDVHVPLAPPGHFEVVRSVCDSEKYRRCL